MKRFDDAKAPLLKTVEWVEEINPSAAASLKEGLDETLTPHRFGLPDPLHKRLNSTNLIESAINVAPTAASRVKRWRGGDMRLRWTAAGLLGAEKQFRRIRGCRLMPKLLAAQDTQSNEIAESPRAA